MSRGGNFKGRIHPTTGKRISDGDAQHVMNSYGQYKMIQLAEELKGTNEALTVGKLMGIYIAQRGNLDGLTDKLLGEMFDLINHHHT